ncbi:MAG: chemotaxis protein CheB [Bacteroidetes bacterium]|nr:chemotaxis protein CheB [Bacteroidota bacterium]
MAKISKTRYAAVAVGTSAGGMKALKQMIEALSPAFGLPMFVVQHLSPQSDSFLPRYLSQFTHLKVKEADPNEPVKPGHVYTAPPNYHMLVERDRSILLSVDEKVNFARPSIDVMFESAAWTYQQRLIGILLTGANNDGARGMCTIKSLGGLTIAQSPDEAEVPAMPESAINLGCASMVLTIKEIASFLNAIAA